MPVVSQRSVGLRSHFLTHIEHAPLNLVAFHAFEQCLEIAFAETVLVVTLALDELEEDRADLGLRKDLQQESPSVVPSSRMPRILSASTGWP